jgi:hypothetical protein
MPVAHIGSSGHRHAQWYLAEGAEELCHGLCQALQKRALPRALMSDNGSPMLTAETTEGLARLGILHETTPPYGPFQNGKQEVNLPNISPVPFRLFLMRGRSFKSPNWKKKAANCRADLS